MRGYARDEVDKTIANLRRGIIAATTERNEIATELARLGGKKGLGKGDAAHGEPLISAANGSPRGSGVQDDAGPAQAQARQARAIGKIAPPFGLVHVKFFDQCRRLPV